MEKVQLVECPRDAWQGLDYHVPEDTKIAHIKQLLKCGFHALDCGSFVNPAAVPQMADTAAVIDKIAPDKGNTRLLVIVANQRGAKDASQFDAIDDLGFPFSINATFQQRNANSNIEEAYNRLGEICDIANLNNKKVVTYLSMAFGNPYQELYQRDDVLYWTERISKLGIDTLSLADTVGSANIEDVEYLFSAIHSQWPHIKTGAHFHSKPGEWANKIKAAYDAGCRRFDGALLGFGGCPFANDSLTGNIPTEGLIHWMLDKAETGIVTKELGAALASANGIFKYN